MNLVNSTASNFSVTAFYTFYGPQEYFTEIWMEVKLDKSLMCKSR
jgi:hypothetical protein